MSELIARQEISLDLVKYKYVTVNAKFEDVNSRWLLIKVLNVGTFFPLDDSYQVKLKIITPVRNNRRNNKWNLNIHLYHLGRWIFFIVTHNSFSTSEIFSLDRLLLLNVYIIKFSVFSFEFSEYPLLFSSNSSDLFPFSLALTLMLLLPSPFGEGKGVRLPFIKWYGRADVPLIFSEAGVINVINTIRMLSNFHRHTYSYSKAKLSPT